MDYGVTNRCGEMPLPAVKGLLDQCREMGIKQLDTAQAYGRAEEKLGMAGVTDFFVTTKIVLQPEEKAEAIHAKVTRSLGRLGVERIGSLLLHNEERMNQHDAGKVAEQLHLLVAKGLVGRIGLSSYDPVQALALCSRHGLQVAQLPANALDRRLLQKGLLDKFLAKGIEVHVRSVFLQGLLLEESPSGDGIPQAAQETTGHFRRACREEGLTPLQGALGSILEISGKIKVIFGVSHARELLQILEAWRRARAPRGFACPSWREEFDPRCWNP